MKDLAYSIDSVFAESIVKITSKTPLVENQKCYQKN
jgi:hypothetical protein